MQIDRWDILARLLVLFLLLPVHEYAHGLVAARLGDPTPQQQGRLTLNPLRHLDMLGSMMMLVMGFGWAKPVQVDPRHFKNPRRGMALVAAAGPLSNLLMALAAMSLYKILSYCLRGTMLLAGFGAVFEAIATTVVFIIIINLRLAVFNLLPIPPLDGSRIATLLLPERLYWGIMRYERFIMLGLMALLWLGLLSAPLNTLTQQLFAAVDWLTQPLDWLLLRLF